MCMLDSLWGLCRPSYPSFWGEGLWWPSELIYFVLVQLCLRYPVIGTYCSLLWVVLRNERILRDIKEFNYRVFVFAFLCLLAVYILLLRCVKNLIELLRVRIINNYVSFETHLRTNSLKAAFMFKYRSNNVPYNLSQYITLTSDIH